MGTGIVEAFEVSISDNAIQIYVNPGMIGEYVVWKRGCLAFIVLSADD